MKPAQSRLRVRPACVATAPLRNAGRCTSRALKRAHLSDMRCRCAKCAAPRCLVRAAETPKSKLGRWNIYARRAYFHGRDTMAAQAAQAVGPARPNRRKQSHNLSGTLWFHLRRRAGAVARRRRKFTQPNSFLSPFVCRRAHTRTGTPTQLHRSH